MFSIASALRNSRRGLIPAKRKMGKHSGLRMERGAIFLVALALPPALSAQTGAEKIQALERQVAEQKRQLRDWGGLLHYGSDNSELKPPKPGEHRVVFFGDQITEYWGKDNDDFFAGKPWLNRGVAGQTTDQMLVRFRQDVIGLQPKAVVILGGINDVAGLHGAATEEMVMDNITSMAELARASGIRVVLASLTPVCDCFTKGSARQRWQERISELNELIEKYSRKNGAVWLDYFSAMSEDEDMKKELTKDGVVPNAAGYKIMAALAEKAVAAALEEK
jgi:lysophospholipase L1-like esterase